jgi:hypothetical protein
VGQAVLFQKKRPVFKKGKAMSENINNPAYILKALHGVIQKVKQPARNQENSYYHNTYADLGSCLDSVKKELFKAGLSMIQYPVDCEDKSVLKLVTLIFNEDGHLFRMEHQMPLYSTKPQDFGSALTYLRRYSINAIFLQFAEDDDDGNAASGKKNGKQKKMESETFLGDRREAMETGQGSEPSLEVKQRDCYLDLIDKMRLSESDEDIDRVKALISTAVKDQMVTGPQLKDLIQKGIEQRKKVRDAAVAVAIPNEDVPF